MPAPPTDAKPRKWSEPENQDRRKRNGRDGADQRHQRRHPNIAGAAQRRRLQIDDPHRDRAGEQVIRIKHRGVERGAAPTKRAEQRRSAHCCAQREQTAGNDGQHHGVKQQRISVVAAPGADRAGYRRGDPATEPAVRHHGHQHEDRKHQRGAGERIGA